MVNDKLQENRKGYANNLFLITTSKQNKDKNRKDRSKYLIITAAGIQYSKPNIKNNEDYDGRGVWRYPHCDGFETTDKILIIIAFNNKNNEALDYAKVFLGWTKMLLYFFKSQVI